MNVDLTREEYAVLMQSLEYSKRKIAAAEGTPPAVKAANLKSVEDVAEKLRRARNNER